MIDDLEIKIKTLFSVHRQLLAQMELFSVQCSYSPSSMSQDLELYIERVTCLINGSISLLQTNL